mmetsp:Transcript_9228/g.24373  ORF Transcript_9228/g.24373 Transcript_9228/m.24373 type:complete len:270 (-) Transcript_9228:68-877(-)
MSATCCVVSLRSIHTASSHSVSPARADTTVAPTITADALFTCSTSSMNPPLSRSPSHTIRSFLRASQRTTSTAEAPNFSFARSTMLIPIEPTSGDVNVTRGTSAHSSNFAASECPGSSALRTAMYPWNPAICVNFGPFATQSPAANTFPQRVVLSVLSTTMPPDFASTSSPNTVCAVFGTTARRPTATSSESNGALIMSPLFSSFTRIRAELLFALSAPTTSTARPCSTATPSRRNACATASRASRCSRESRLEAPVISATLAPRRACA